MTADDRQQRIEALFHRACDLEPAARDALLDAESGGDATFRAEVLELLRLDASTSTPLEQPAVRPGPDGSLPDHIGDYAIERQLGSGGMGTVYLARQTRPVQRMVALKVIRHGPLSQDSELIRRFFAERQALARMQHPGIAQVFDAGQTEDGHPFLVMEFVDGKSITKHCDAVSLGLEQRIRLLIDVCCAVQHAHFKGVVHRDLKPSNILVADDSANGSIAKVIDFGVAKALDEPLAEGLAHTSAGAVLGTPEYMSPEQAAGDTDRIDSRTDVFALGAVLFELLTGRPPTDNPSSEQPPRWVRLHRAIARTTQPPSRCLAEAGRLASQSTSNRSDHARADHRPFRAEQLRGELDWITERAIATDPEQRYPTAAAFGEDLQRYLDGQPVLAGPPSAWYRLRKFVARNRWPAALVALATIALTVAFGVALWQWQRATDFANAATARLADYRAMADIQLLDELDPQAREELWPAVPSRRARWVAWIERAQALVRRRTSHSTTLARIESVLERRGATTEERWQIRILGQLTDRLERLGADGGTIAEVTEGIAQIDRLERTRRQYDAGSAWRRAIASIRSRDECPLYRGLALTPAEDLIPLGRNPKSGLWEFWHIASGAHPATEDGGVVEMRKDDGIVLVLVPGGTFSMGAERSDTPGPNRDPGVVGTEVPAHEVSLDPFYLAKFELTQAQWMRHVGTNPSKLPAPGTVGPRAQATWTWPVDRVSWRDCQRVLHQLGLRLPTEAQWEYACRAGTRTVYYSGDTRQSVLAVGANFADSASAKYFGRFTPEPNTDDGFAYGAPVGSFAPNPWGLHDMMGNVGEWCRDRIASYELPVRDGDGLRLTDAAVRPGREPPRAQRGGHFNGNFALLRSAARGRYPEVNRTATIGVRPSRPIDR